MAALFRPAQGQEIGRVLERGFARQREDLLGSPFGLLASLLLPAAPSAWASIKSMPGRHELEAAMSAPSREKCLKVTLPEKESVRE
ncbi:MAG: hypothetical protein FJW20_25490 [Acidimicrobiia bacterium]|nr:hypothetical protein [Acidimicrobiia bacterium]